MSTPLFNLSAVKADSSVDLVQQNSVNLRSRLSLVRLFAVMMLVIIAVTSPTISNAASLGDLFGDSESAQEQSFLPVSDAFTVVPMQKDTVLTVSIEITPEHYVYKDKFKLKLPEGVSAGELSFNQPAHFVDDPDFGEVAVFDQPNVTATATLSFSSDFDGNSTTQSATLIWQGCAKAGLCYPPQREAFTIKPAVSTSTYPSSVANRPTVTSPTMATDAMSSQSVATNTQAKAALTNNNLSSNNSTAQTSTNSTVNNNVNNNVNNTTVSQNERHTDRNQANGIGVEASENPIVGGADSTQNSSDESEEAIDNGLATSTVNTQGIEPQSADAQANNLNSLNNTDTLKHTTEVATDPFGIATRPVLAFILLFLAGLTLAFTPCILPMLPIVSNIVARQHNPTAMKGVMLTGAYGLGVAVAYGILGAVIAIFGVSLGIIGWLQNPVVLIVFAAIFAVLALYMLDALNISMPQSIRSRLHRFSQKGDKYLGSVPGSFIAGALSALVVSPCVSGPLFGALLAVSTIGNPLLGFAALFVLGFGLSAPLMLLGATQGNLMPKAGAWMDWVKVGFALMLFAVSLLLIERVLVSPLMLLLWAVWFLVVALWAWSWRGRAMMLIKAIAVVAGIWAVALVAGAAMGANDTWQPLAKLGSNHQAQYMPIAPPTNALPQTNTPSGRYDQLNPMPVTQPLQSQIKVTTLSEFDTLLTKYPKVVAEVTAEWCIECRILERELFGNPPASLQGWQVVKIDITDTTDDSKAILERYQIPGPPTFLYYVDGQLKELQVGEVTRDEFSVVLNEHS